MSFIVSLFSGVAGLSLKTTMGEVILKGKTGLSSRNVLKTEEGW